MVSPGSPSNWAAIAGQFRNSMNIHGYAADPAVSPGTGATIAAGIVTERGRLVAVRAASDSSGTTATDLGVSLNGSAVPAAAFTVPSGATVGSIAGLSQDVEPGDKLELTTGANVDANVLGLVVTAEILQRFD